MVCMKCYKYKFYIDIFEQPQSKRSVSNSSSLVDKPNKRSKFYNRYLLCYVNNLSTVMGVFYD